MSRTWRTVRLCCWLVVGLLAGCEASGPAYWRNSWVATPELDSCGVYGADADAARNVLARTGESLVAFSDFPQALNTLVRTLPARVLLSNPQALGLDEASVASLRKWAAQPTAGITRVSEDAWRPTEMASAESKLVVKLRFHNAAGDPVAVDPTQLESYLVGAKGTSTMSFEQMFAAPDVKNTFTIQWQSLGPLGDVLAGPRGQVPNPLQLHLSMRELQTANASFDQPDGLGLFENLRTIATSADLSLQDVAAPAVRYLVSMPRQSGLAVTTPGDLQLALLGLRAADDTASLAFGAGPLLVLNKHFVGTLEGALRTEAGEHAVRFLFGESGPPMIVVSCP